MAAKNGRELALDIIMEVMEKDGFCHILLRRVLQKYDYLPQQEKAFISRLALGTIEHCIELDAIIDQVSKTKVKKMKPLIRNVIRMTLYQILYMDRIPNPAAINEAVLIVKKRGLSQLSGFVNGVLRNADRKKDSFVLSEREKFSMPEYLYEELKKQYPEQYQTIMKGFLSHESRGLMLRVNRSRMSRKEEKEAMEGLNAALVNDQLGLYEAKGIEGAEGLELFCDGKITIQEIGSSFVSYLASPKKGDECLDLCAAPGGKTIHLADLMENTGHILSTDLSEAKLPLIEEAAERCQFANISIRQMDASEFRNDLEAKFDVVLCDVPCSGWGIIGNKPDIKYKASSRDNIELVSIQRKIAENGIRYAKEGATIIYSTCTINHAENEANVEYFQEHFPVELLDITNELPEEYRKFVKNKMALFLPGYYEGEGFFIAKLKKISKDL